MNFCSAVVLSSALSASRCKHCTALVRKETAMWKWGLLISKFRKELLLAWSILRDIRTPASAKLATIAAVLYVISPMDIAPDFIPILGWIDDGVIALILLKLAQKLLPEDLLASLKSKLDSKSHPAQAK
jgi:uncharacterized membrane protein YkvA (DUF1232 family)